MRGRQRGGAAGRVGPSGRAEERAPEAEAARAQGCPGGPGLAARGCSAQDPETYCCGRASSSAVSSFTLAVAAVPPWLVFLLVSGTDFLPSPPARLLCRGLPASLSATFLPPFSAYPPPGCSLLLLLRTPRPPRAPRPPHLPPTPPRLPVSRARCRLRGYPAPRARRHCRQPPPPTAAKLSAAACALEPERGLVWVPEQVRDAGARAQEEPSPWSALLILQSQVSGTRGLSSPEADGGASALCSAAAERSGGGVVRPRGCWAPSPRAEHRPRRFRAPAIRWCAGLEGGGRLLWRPRRGRDASRGGR